MPTFHIDLRSDIRTVPTPAMRRAMAEARVCGDVVATEDFATTELEETCAGMFGREAGLFVCSGTMGNLVSLLTLSRPGFTLIGDPYTHIISSELKGFERLAGCTAALVETDGVLTADMVRRCLAQNAIADGSAMICAENTHALRNGKAWGSDITAGLVTVAGEHKLKLHIDGARIFNAAVATGESVASLTQGADTVQLCLSKGLGAPMGSVIVGTKETIARARQLRQMVGGCVHKSGIMAAAALVGLRETPSLMPEDHRRAKRLGDLLAQQKPLRLDYPVYTNIVHLFFDSQEMDGEKFVALLAQQGIGVTGPWNSPNGQWLRLVTHYGITDEDIETVAIAVADAVKQSRPAKR